MKNKSEAITVWTAKFTMRHKHKTWYVSFYVDGIRHTTFYWINAYDAFSSPATTIGEKVIEGKTLKSNVSVRGASKLLRQYLKTVK